MPIHFYGPSVFRKYYMQIICTFFAILSLVASPAAAQQSNLGPGQCVTNYDPNVDYFPSKLVVDWAALFSIQYFKNYKILTNTKTNDVFALYQCGTPAPTDVPSGAKVIQIPVNRVATLTTTNAAFLEFLGVRTSIVAVGTGFDISSPCLQKQLETGNVIMLSQTNQTLYSEQVRTVDVVYGAFTAEPQINNSVSTSEALDPGVLNRAEWLEYFSAFYNLEDRATNLTNTINNNYNLVKRAATTAYQSLSKPVVAWVSYDSPSSYNNNTPSWSFSNASYKAQLVGDAGGTLMNPTTLFYSNSSAFLSVLADADVVVDESYIAPALQDVLKNFGITNDTKSNFKFIRDEALYRPDGIQTIAGGWDWFEAAVVQEDAVLLDIVNVVNPKFPYPEFQRIWFRNMVKGEQVKYSTSVNCTTELTAPRGSYFNFSGTFVTSGATPVQSPLMTAITMTVFAIVGGLFVSLF